MSVGFNIRCKWLTCKFPLNLSWFALHFRNYNSRKKMVRVPWEHRLRYQSLEHFRISRSHFFGVGLLQVRAGKDPHPQKYRCCLQNQKHVHCVSLCDPWGYHVWSARSFWPRGDWKDRGDQHWGYASANFSGLPEERSRNRNLTPLQWKSKLSTFSVFVASSALSS